MNGQKILITGASGFVGSTVVDKALEQGFETWAGIRSTSSREYLQDERIRFIDFNYSDKEELTEELSRFTKENGKFDYIVHCAGITKARTPQNFYKINFENTKNFVDALIEAECIPDRFIFMSTLGVMGPGDESDYEPFRPGQPCKPNTHYGKSKFMAENYLKSLADFPYILLRPTGVYGPRDKDYLILIRAVKNGLSVSAGFRKQLLTFIYVEDLAKIVFDCIGKKMFRKEYYVADGNVCTDTEFNAIVRNALGKKWVVCLKIPLWIIKLAAFVSEKIALALGKVGTFNTDKYKIMKQRNWSCDISPLKTELDFRPAYYLKAGMAKTVEWYKEQGWL